MFPISICRRLLVPGYVDLQRLHKSPKSTVNPFFTVSYVLQIYMFSVETWIVLIYGFHFGQTTRRALPNLRFHQSMTHMASKCDFFFDQVEERDPYYYYNFPISTFNQNSTGRQRDGNKTIGGILLMW